MGEAMMQISWDGIPAVLTGLEQWLLWKLEIVGERPTKVPYQASGRKASSTAPKTWTTFARVQKAFASGKFTGIGFAVTREDGFVGVDLDHVIDTETGEVAAWAVDFIERDGRIGDVY